MLEVVIVAVVAAVVVVVVEELLAVVLIVLVVVVVVDVVVAVVMVVVVAVVVVGWWRWWCGGVVAVWWFRLVGSGDRRYDRYGCGGVGGGVGSGGGCGKWWVVVVRVVLEGVVAMTLVRCVLWCWWMAGEGSWGKVGPCTRRGRRNLLAS